MHGLECVWSPKARTAWHLHDACSDLPQIEGFTMFSSVASLLGNTGQANYAAANAALDRLARLRRSMRLAGNSVQWGAWAGVGMAVQSGTAERLGLSAIREEVNGLCALELAVIDRPAVVVTVPIEWPVLLAKQGAVMRRFLSQVGLSGYTVVESTNATTVESDVELVPAPHRPVPSKQDFIGCASDQAWPLTQMQLAYVAGAQKITGLDGRNPRSYCEVLCPAHFQVHHFVNTVRNMLRELAVCRTYLVDGPQGIPVWRTLPYDDQAVARYSPQIMSVPEACQDAYWKHFREFNRKAPGYPSSSEFPAFQLCIHQSAASTQASVVSVSIPYELGQHMLLMAAFANAVAAETRQVPSWPQSQITPAEYMYFLSLLPGTERYDQSKRYWLNRLHTLPEPPQLPMMQQRGTESYIYNLSNLEVESTIRYSQVKAACHQLTISPTALFIGTFGATVATFSDKSNFTIGMLANWEPPRVDGLKWPVGPAGRSLMLTEIDIQPADSWASYLTRINNEIIENFRHMHFEPLLMISDLKAIWNNQDTVFGVQAPGVLDSSQTDQLKDIRYFMPQTCHVLVDAMFWFNDSSAALNKLMYLIADELIDESLASSMMQLHLSAMNSVVTDSSLWTQPVSFTGSAPAVQTDLDMAIPSSVRLFEDFFNAAFAQPAARAVASGALDGDKFDLSYQQVAMHALTTALFLKDMQPQAHTESTELVAVIMHKAWEQVVAVIGVQLAGYAYLPISAGYPMLRIKTVLALGQVQTVLTQQCYELSLEWPKGVMVFSVNTITGTTRPAISQLRTTYETLKPHDAPVASDLAYVIFTSGT